MTVSSLVLALPIFPGRLQPSIVGRSELNFRVRDGNGWTLALISTNLLFFEKKSKQKKLYLKLSSPYRSFQQQVLYLLSILLSSPFFKDLELEASSLTSNSQPLTGLVHLHGLEPGTH